MWLYLTILLILLVMTPVLRARCTNRVVSLVLGGMYVPGGLKVSPAKQVPNITPTSSAVYSCAKTRVSVKGVIPSYAVDVFP